MITEKELKTLPTHLQWVKDLQIGEVIEVFDNSYCFDITNERKMCSLRKDIHSAGETGEGLEIKDIFLKGWKGYFSKNLKVYPTVILKSRLNGHKFEVGICWGKPR